MQIRDRIRELRRVRASELKPHPKNWRSHPAGQRDALRGVLAEIGYADALLARELPDGGLQLIDGHLRAETTPDAEVPVLVVDLDDQETALLLTVLDPIAGLAETDAAALDDLLGDVHTQNEAVQKLVEGLSRAAGAAEETIDSPPQPNEVPVPELYQVVIECDDEEQQRAVYERMSGEGLRCTLRVL